MSNSDDDRRPTLDELKAENARLFGENVHKIKDSQPSSTTLQSDDEIIAALSKYYATLTYGGGFFIVNKTIPGKVTFMTRKAFINSLEDQRKLTTTTDPSGSRSKLEPVSKVWLESPSPIKHRYHDLVFNTRKPFEINDPVFNLWDGFHIQPSEGDLLAH